MNLEKIKNSKVGQNCIVFGNGYSLRNMDLAPLIEIDSFCANWFCLHPLYKYFNSLTHAVSDKALFGNGEKVANQFIGKIIENTDVKLLLNVEQRALIEQTLQKFPKRDLAYLKYTREKTVWDGNFSDDILGELYFGYTVVIDFILPAVSWMGYKNVFLLGVDCNYRLNEDINFNSSYFFEASKLPLPILEHMKNQRKNKGSQSKLIEWNKGFKVVYEYFNQNDRKLFSVENQGSLTCLPTLDFQSFLKIVK